MVQIRVMLCDHCSHPGNGKQVRVRLPDLAQLIDDGPDGLSFELAGPQCFGGRATGRGGLPSPTIDAAVVQQFFEHGLLLGWQAFGIAQHSFQGDRSHRSDSFYLHESLYDQDIDASISVVSAPPLASEENRIALGGRLSRCSPLLFRG